MREPLNLKGQKYSMLTAIEMIDEREPSNGCAKWVCKCDCGHYTIVNSNSLRTGTVKSCGCLRRRHYNEETRR